MPKLSSLFSKFDNLDQIDIESLASWLKPAPNYQFLHNYLANKILYPQTVPLTYEHMRIDLAILREAIRLNGDNPFINITLRKILIPAQFLSFCPNLTDLTWVFVDALLMGRRSADFYEDLWTVVLTGDREETIGSIILPRFKENGSLEVKVMNKNYKVRQGSLVVIPCPKDRCEISYRLQKGEILGKNESAVEIYGGKLGLMIDGRKS